MLGCVKKPTCYLRAGQINPEENLLECKSKALFSWIVLQCLESKSITLSLQHSNISKEFGNFAIQFVSRLEELCVLLSLCFWGFCSAIFYLIYIYAVINIEEL